MKMPDGQFFGRYLKLSVRGASHAPSMSFALENFPHGFKIDEKALVEFMERRAPGRDKLSTQRRESDEVIWRSGLADGVTTGGTIRGEILNRDMRPNDYGAERTIPRPGHADFGQWVETGRIPTGGGKNSGRLTAPLCAAGGLCQQWLEARGIGVSARLRTVGGKTNANDMLREIERARKDGDSVGGEILCAVSGLPAGLGGSLFEGLETAVSAAIFGIPGVKGISFGLGSDKVCRMRGSEYNDSFTVADGRIGLTTQRQGGILGGRSAGTPIHFTVAMRPTPTVYKPQASVDLATMRPAECAMTGRHDPCIVRRAVPVVEAMTAFAIADAILADEAAHPRICLTLTGKTVAEDLEQYKSQLYFTDMVELRVDLLKKSERARVGKFLSMLVEANAGTRLVPVILTFRRACDGGAFAGDEAEREQFFKKVLKSPVGAGLAYVDFEEDFGNAKLVAQAHAAGVKVIRSLHDFTSPVKNLPARLKKLFATGDVAKIAFMPKTLADVARLFRELADFTAVPHVVCAMGPLGLASRVLAGRTNSLWTYTSVGGLDGIGHVTPFELVRTYRFRSVTRGAALFGVTGWPLKATRSPELNNIAWSDEDRDAVMVPFPSKTAKDAVAFMRSTGMKGMAVTIPHKQAIMPLLDKIDAAAKTIGAVNTVVDEGGKLVGYNTDAEGFGEAIRKFVGRDDFKGMKVAVLGAGGASKAVVYALKKLHAKVEVVHRRPLKCGFDLIVNATPVDPIPEYAFTGKESVYDLVYVPDETPLMARARAAGCRVENGLSMLVAQARAQRKLWRRA